jgi:hypothetical protein
MADCRKLRVYSVVCLYDMCQSYAVVCSYGIQVSNIVKGNRALQVDYALDNGLFAVSDRELL